ncbi:probable LRR receptor-like serine/threonine-protein kinase At3g47570 [Durio zibethinus]|uniref:Probable LRR receptor-like serine/threonine-protein kinase At3g47570 n=1 Tax=Durio zibethinus TaxID=66656 RepID=A0A6P6ALW5_DURZI|nr:probable LRR receptor-like serine/threonine-protein kinase At3g47570 [Durio zibethinus]
MSVYKELWHRNLVKLSTACSSVDFQGNEFKALVYEFMPKGSLESWLHPFPNALGNGVEDDLRILSFLQRVNISIDVASAPEYLHHHCQTPIVQHDLKPNNVLLDNDMTAHVSDFGATIYLSFVEYAMRDKVSTYGDIYSYGILLLEMFTGKRPTAEMFNDGLGLHNFVFTALPERISEVVDPLFVAGGGGEEEEEITNEDIYILADIKKDQLQDSLTEMLRIGVASSVESHRERRKLCDVLKELQLVRGLLLVSAIK